MDAAIQEAKNGLEKGGIPIGSVLVLDGRIIGRGHNQRIQKSSSILHAEMDCLENAGRLTAKEYAKCTIYSTLSPCDMCSGAILLYKIRTVILGENQSFIGPEKYVQSRGVEIINYDNNECKQMMNEFMNSKPELWNEDIGE
ncbi:MAG: tRNA-specific adenosine deaminase [Candidatus Heimdallarchaeota archaeon LC_2]|nr:MAG: tRNA-specific adenosine deaminase [Candidatus Heimdallarchaeota archaeon LC_2]